MRSERVAFLDSLRAIAALLVFLVHSAAPMLRQGGELLRVDLAMNGVTIFFVVSAFSLCLSLAREGERGEIRWGAYFIRRFFRIAPLYYAVLLLGTAHYVETGKGLSLLMHLTFANVFATQYANDLISVEWTIVVEWGFYLALPVLFVVSRRPVALLCLAIFSFVLWARFYRIVVGLGGSISLWSPTFPAHLYAFVAGMAAFWVVSTCRPSPAVARIGFLAVAAVACAVLIAGENRWSGPAFALMTALTIVCCSADPAGARVLSTRPLVWIGTVSYSIYLTHLIALDNVSAIFGRSTLTIVFALGVTIALSSLTYLAIEQPGRALGRWLAEGRIRMRPAAE
jgi:peptidoglycan/LPS O-acetylase OafA/YrhL